MLTKRRERAREREREKERREKRDQPRRQREARPTFHIPCEIKQAFIHSHSGSDWEVGLRVVALTQIFHSGREKERERERQADRQTVTHHASHTERVAFGIVVPTERPPESAKPLRISMVDPITQWFHHTQPRSFCNTSGFCLEVFKAF